MPRRYLAGVVLALLLSLLGRGAAETPSAQVERLAKEASEAYRAGNYEHAVELLGQAYQIQPLSAILYNVAKGFEKLGDTEHAIMGYQRYIEAEDADPTLKAKAEARLAALKKGGAKAGAAAKPHPKDSSDSEEKADAEAGESEGSEHEERHHSEVSELRPPSSPKAPPKVVLDPRQLKRRHRERVAAVTLITLGGAALASAVGLSVEALNQFNLFRGTNDQFAQMDFRASAQTYALAADTLYVAGGAAVVASAVLFYFGYHNSETKPLTLAPLLSPGGLGISVGGHF